MTAPIGTSSQYSTAKIYTDRIQGNSSNLSGSPEDLERIKAYSLYEDMYYNRPENFKVLLRGDNDDPVYIPSAKKIVEAMNRFLCKGFTFVVNPSEDPAADAELNLQMGNLFKREKFASKFSSQKRFGLIRGDAMFYVVGDPTKEQGSRLSIYELNPGNYFPILDPNDRNRVIGCHIVEVVRDLREKDDKTKTVARRRTYLKGGVTFNQTLGIYEQLTPTPGVWTEVTHWEIGKWDDRNMKKDDLKQVKGGGLIDVPMFQLPAPINSLPVYHWQNIRMESGFGISEVSGIETLIAATNQVISDAQLTFVLQGLGVYATDSKPPQDDNGNPLPWSIGPGSVVETATGKQFQRVTGVASMQPAIELLNELKNDAQEANGVPDIAAGKVDVTVAESGVSLALQLAPILAAGKEKEDEILSTTDHMLYDLKTMWFPAYEGINFGESTEISTHVDDPMPVNRDARIQEIMLLFTSNLITISMAQAELAKLGYKFSANSEQQVLLDAAALARAQGGEDNRYSPETEPEELELTPGAGTIPDNSGLGGDSLDAGDEMTF